MDFSFYANHRNWIPTLQQRAQNLLEPASKIFKTKIPVGLLKALLFIFLSTWLGTIAFDKTAKWCLETWHQEHRPGTEFWIHALRALKLDRVSDAKRLNTIFRSLRISVDTAPGAVWIDSERSHVVLFESDNQTVVFERKPQAGHTSRTMSVGWEPMGQGWPALEKTIEALKHIVKAGPILTHKAKPRDPREILY